MDTIEYASSPRPSIVLSRKPPQIDSGGKLCRTAMDYLLLSIKDVMERWMAMIAKKASVACPECKDSSLIWMNLLHHG